jgi:hypothetical protein
LLSEHVLPAILPQTAKIITCLALLRPTSASLPSFVGVTAIMQQPLSLAGIWHPAFNWHELNVYC